jgi:hypothetical protein
MVRCPIRRIPAVLALVCSLSGSAFAAPKTVPFQGVLKGADGKLKPNGPYALTVSLYTTAVGGVAEWSDVKAVIVTGGLFSTALGDTPADPLPSDFSKTYYVGVKVGTDPEMTPRVPLLAVPYALALSAPASLSGADALPILSVKNEGTGAAIWGIHSTTSGVKPGIQGDTSSTDANAIGVLGQVTSTAPGGFSSAVRGVNSGAGGLGIGVYGSHAGSGWGVYGVAPQGIGVYGNSGAGYGLYGMTTTGVGLYATASGAGTAASFSSTDAANTLPTVAVSGAGSGAAMAVSESGTGSALTAQISGAGNGSPVVSVSTAGSGAGVDSLSQSSFGVWGKTNSTSGAGVVGDNFGGGEAIVGRTTSDIGAAVVGRNNGGYAGVRGFSVGSGPGVLGQGGIQGSTGSAGLFENINASNTAKVVEIRTNGSGITLSATNSSAASGGAVVDASAAGYGAAVHASSAGGHGVWGITSVMSSAGVLGDNFAGGEAVVGRNNGSNAGAVVGRNDGGGYGVRGFNVGAGIGVLGQAGVSGGTGIAGVFENVSSSNASNALEARTSGAGYAGSFTASAASGKGVSISTQGGYALIVSGGRVGIGNTTPSYTLDVAGYVRATNISVISDGRLKKDVRPLSGALDKVMALRGVSYAWRNDQPLSAVYPAGRQIGFIAQQVAEVLPEIVNHDEKGYESVSYQNVAPVLVEAVKQLKAEKDAAVKAANAKVRGLERELAALRAANVAFEARLKRLESRKAH